MKNFFLKKLISVVALTVMTSNAVRVPVFRSIWTVRMATRAARALDRAEAQQRQFMIQQKLAARQRLAALRPGLQQRVVQRQLTPDVLVQPGVPDTVAAFEAVNQSQKLIRDIQLQRTALEEVLPTLNPQRAEEIIIGFEQYGALFRAPELLRRESAVVVDAPSSLFRELPAAVEQEDYAAPAARLQDEQAELRARLEQIKAELVRQKIPVQELVPVEAAAVQQ